MDTIFESWLERQYADGLALCVASDVLTLVPEAQPNPPRRYFAQFASPTMVRSGNAVIRAKGFAVLFRFPPEYLRTANDAAQIVQLLAPDNLFHPNVAWPFICIGRIAPGTGLCELVYRVHEILTFSRLTVRENDALNHEACAWARRNMSLFPLSSASLRRRDEIDFAVEQIPNPELRHGADGA